MRKEGCAIAAIALVYLLASCAVVMPPYWQGRSLLKEGRYDEAIEKFELALQKMPGDVRSQCDLGIAHYEKGEYDKAIPALNKAKAMNPKYGKTYLYLGLTYEKMNDPARALEEYANYRKLGPASLVARKIKRRMKQMIRQQYAARIRQIAEDEAALDVASIPENTIAVTYFENISGSEELAPLQKGLADMLMTDLSQVESLRVLERIRLNALLEEMNLGVTGIIDQTTAPRAGMLLGANRIVTGGYTTPDEDSMRIDTFLVKTKESQLEASEDVSGALGKFFDLEKQLVLKIVEGMGIRLSPEEEDAIRKVPTESFLAFLAYSRGLDYEDRGMYAEAAAEFQTATRLDPDFSNAQVKMREMQQEVAQPVIEESVDAEVLEETQEQVEEQEIMAEAMEPVPAVSPTGRLARISENLSEGLPQIHESKRATPQSDTNVVNIVAEWE